jgi:ParB family chromosome partitioning protein
MTKANNTTAAAASAAHSGSEIFIPLNKLKKSPRNARRTPHSTASIEAKAASIAAKGILQNLVVEPELTTQGEETGFYLVTIGEGRRLAQLLRVKRKQIKKTEPIRCVINTASDAREISLDENVTREAMHPADEFEAFRDLAERQGWGAEDIAARFGVTAHVVRQRLRLGSVSPALMQLYRDGELNLDQLMAFAIVDDHERQEQVYDNLSEWDRSPSAIRNELTKAHVAADDKRALFVGQDAYTAAGGAILCDLFTEEGGGYFEDVALLDRLASEKLAAIAEEVQREGWKWVSVQMAYPHGHGLRRIHPETVELSDKDEAAYTAAQSASEALLDQYIEDDELPPEVEQQRLALEAQMERLDALRTVFSAADMARAGVLVCLSHDGGVRVDRGLVRADDEAEEGGDAEAPTSGEGAAADAAPSLPDSLVRDLTAHRTQALRLAVGEQPAIALLAVTHALAVRAFYVRTDESCLELRSDSPELAGFAPGIKDSGAARKVAERHEAWSAEVPLDGCDLWDFVAGLSEQDRLSLLAHCASLTINTVKQPGQSAHRLAAADKLATAVGLDMAAHWSPTPQSFFGRITKPQILGAIAEATGKNPGQRIEDMKKPAMAEAAAKLVAGTGWLPLPLRKPEAANDQRSNKAA